MADAQADGKDAVADAQEQRACVQKLLETQQESRLQVDQLQAHCAQLEAKLKTYCQYVEAAVHLIY